MPFSIDQYILSIIREGGWELRYTPQRQPYAYLPQGFGSNEPGIRLLFSPLRGQIRVTGAIEHSDTLRIKRPFLIVSTEGSYTPANAAEYIKSSLIPRYREAWQAAQPVIEEHLVRSAEREQVTEEVRRVLNLFQEFDWDRGVEVMTGKSVEAIINNDLSVALKLQVPKDLAVEIMKMIKRYREGGPDTPR
jgi:hypothetical protein